MHAEIVQYAWSHCTLVVAASFSGNVSPLAHVYHMSEGGSKETCCGKLTGGLSRSHTRSEYLQNATSAQSWPMAATTMASSPLPAHIRGAHLTQAHWLHLHCEFLFFGSWGHFWLGLSICAVQSHNFGIFAECYQCQKLPNGGYHT